MQLPLMFEMTGQSIICVGGGPVAAAKVLPMLDCGAVVTVIAPVVAPALDVVPMLRRRPYASDDLDTNPRPRLVIAATGVPAVDDQVAADAASRGIWCLRIDGRGDVAVPGVIRRSGLVLAMTTGAPALTKRLRQTLEDLIDQRWGQASTTLGSLRADPAIRAALAPLSPEDRRSRWHRAVDVMLAAEWPGVPTTVPAQAESDAEAILRGQHQDRETD